MKLSIKDLNKKYVLSFDSITQLCGTNIPLKKYIIDSICKHFSSEKYKEYEECFIDNIEIDGDIPGRKQWECYKITSRENIIETIQISKGSILNRCIKEYINSFECQSDLYQIDALLVGIFDKLNKELFENDTLKLSYDTEDLFGMIQHTSIRTAEDKDVHNLTTMELFDVFINIISKQQELIPEKRMFIVENIDHIVGLKDYLNIIIKCEELSKKSNIWFIFATSLDGYVNISDYSIESINIINDDIFIMPSTEHIMDFIRDNYPLERHWEKSYIQKCISNIIQKIGSSIELFQPDELVLLKLINETNNIRKNWKNGPKTPEIQCLLNKKVI